MNEWLSLSLECFRHSGNPQEAPEGSFGPRPKSVISLIHPVTHSFIHPLIHSSINSLVCPRIHSFIQPLIHSFIHYSIIHPFTHHSLIQSSTHLLIHPSIRSLIRSIIIHSFVCTIIHSSIHSFIHSSMNWSRPPALLLCEPHGLPCCLAHFLRTSPVAQWLRLCLPMQGTRVPSLVGELRSHMPQGNKALGNH